ncbi:prolyl oligopeptidase family serine peptidase [Fulvivirgaceae bacterium BMA12]|uniref:Prolyl oligopeptidase family serine peptidase n=1 Tax=Agaribacillus aureus TaxID=3051825 RepID=A0ABT8LGB4_9BACT|nr:prolyl oligopeptidase family serine peptidase [Fulvivirgaceae bacterium BMA12]
MRKNIFIHLVLGVLLAVSDISWAQAPITFKEGLMLEPAGRRNRSAVFTDELYHQFVTGKLKTPAEHDEVRGGKGNVPRRWEKITSAEEGIFKDNKLRGGWLYLTYDAPETSVKILEISGHGEVYFNNEPRGGDVYNKGWVVHPVKLQKGKNALLVKGARGGAIKIKLVAPGKPVFLTQKDMTIPDLITTEQDEKIAAIRIVNASPYSQKKLRIVAEVNGRRIETKVASIIPMTTRKVPYTVIDDASKEGTVDVRLQLYRGNSLLDETTVTYDVKQPQKNYKRTFISKIDGSVQYFGVREGKIDEDKKAAMFLSVHGAGVKGIRQAGSYQSKDWGHVIAPTNRREFGFDWEDWGRWDAMEVQSIAEKMYKTDPRHTYLTGHSMGGHGTWQLGAIFPGKWAAIAPVAGWYSFFSYGGKSASETPTPMQKMLLRASNSSNTLELSRNYLHHGVYILHGDADNNVPVGQARFMKKHLAEFHPNFVYQEEPEAGHWFGIDKEPIFSYFKRHDIPEDRHVKSFEFRTASPGVSSTSRFVTLYQQTRPFEFCGVKVGQTTLTRREQRREPDKRLKNRSIEVETENLNIFKLDLAHCAGADTLTVKVDDVLFEDLVMLAGKEVWFGKSGDTWKRIEEPTDSTQKNPKRYGNFKDAFQHEMLFVYGTRGNSAENEWAFNKARFDAETFYYRGNGSIDIIPDRAFKPEKYKDRSVIIYGNASTNSAWKVLLGDSPVQVKRNEIAVGNKKLTGGQWGTYFIRPRKDSPIASVGVVSGTGMAGFSSVDPNRYFVSGTGFPDLMIISSDMFIKGFDGVKAAGYFGNDWSVENGDIQWAEQLEGIGMSQ